MSEFGIKESNLDDLYMEKERKTFESKFNKNKELDETDKQPQRDLETALNSKYDSYMENKDLSAFERGRATNVKEDDSDKEQFNSKIDNHYNDHLKEGKEGAADDSTNISLNDANDHTCQIQDEPSKVLKRDELDLLKSGNEAINRRVDAQADDYRKEGLSENEIRDRLSADKWNFQKEFLNDAFPGQDVSPCVFNGFYENGAKDRMAEIKQSESLRNQLITDAANKSNGAGENRAVENEWGEIKRNQNPLVDAKEDFVDDKTKLANDIMRDCNVGKADFTDFDPDVAVAVSDAIKEAKNDFPDLEVKYIGSIDTQVNGIKNELIDYYYHKFEDIPNSGLTKGQIERAAEYNANKFITGEKLNETNGTFAWSLNISDAADPLRGGLSKYNGVAINKDYASDNAKFTAAKVQEVATKHKPIGCDTPRATVDHELGHEIGKMLGARYDPEINKMYNEMITNGDAENKLSGYSKKNVDEFIAESYSEYRNNPQPREYANKVYQRLEYLYSQRKVS